METENAFHCCATCIHFRVEKGTGGASYRCSRLTYETRPDYRFQCWTPTEKVKRLMEARKSQP
ncbi:MULTISPECIES: hypothetical protein [Brevibacillus]|uniref:hypothetical protein n=1 Tax=Brevibacillus TaxID=55080 RepID=UPI000D0E4313|nr:MULTISPECIES: hypothetical protein [Brevibacillus]PSJ66461.1 hypothetical protein C7J99_25235 [Brevibacillus brevis]RED24123.1 hypothetical protein DES34_114147 [Brevibacillus brevis]TQK73472.1 hypothetical protein FB479_102101 [Brevibacillus sp. AG162]VEF90223.1 Uncharacterised protein [Brevibacillus brevis]GEC92176.1 hypothetical protein BBR01nite_45070 [Brevibacillus brevis]